MGFWQWLAKLFETPTDRYMDVSQPEPEPTACHGLDELARRLAMDIRRLESVPISYGRATIPKRSGGQRILAIPSIELAQVQRAILRRLLAKLAVHPAATAFEPGKSIVDNALPHANKDIVLRMDVRGFFPHTSADRVRHYFRMIGWNDQAADLLVRLTTHDGGLPQGAPTSPRLSNLVNFGLDERFRRFAERYHADYTRYADDITFSWNLPQPAPERVSKYARGFPRPPQPTLAPRDVIRHVRVELERLGYRINARKTRVLRKGHRQMVTGLVVNEAPALPRKMRRTLRAVHHHLETGRPATMTPDQLAGWYAFQQMVRSRNSG